MAQIEVRDDDGNTVHVNTVTGETTHQPANVFETLVQSAFEVFTTDDKR